EDEEAEFTDTTDAHGSIGKDFWRSVRKLQYVPTYWTLLGAFIFSFFTIGGVSFWLPFYLSETFHLTAGSAGISSDAALLRGGLLGTVLGGWLADYIQQWYPQGRLLTATLGFLVGAPLAFLGLTLHNLAMFIVVIGVAITFLSFCTGPLNAVMQDIVIPQV